MVNVAKLTRIKELPVKEEKKERAKSLTAAGKVHAAVHV